jgi:hypothetical protein
MSLLLALYWEFVERIGWMENLLGVGHLERLASP